MKILILNEMVQGITKNTIYDVLEVDYQDSEGNSCYKDKADFETFYYKDDNNHRAYDYRNIKTKECDPSGNDFEIFETDLEVAKYLVNKYNLNVEVKPIVKEIPINKGCINKIAENLKNGGYK